MNEAIFDPDGPDTTETTERVSAIRCVDGLIREERVDADVVINDAACDLMAVEAFQMVMERMPDRAGRAFRRLMRLLEQHDDTAAAMTMFLVSRR